jgi:MFS family permease
MDIDTSSNPPEDALTPFDAYSAIRVANFRRYWIGNILSILGMQMQSATVVWEVFERTGNTFNIGLVGLVQVIPVLSLMLLAGHVADRRDRRWVLIGAISLGGLASLGLAAVSFFDLPIAFMFVCLSLIGVARAFQQPAKSSLVPELVPSEIFSNAVTWNLGGFQLSAVTGPALAGAILALFGRPYIVYLLQVGAAATFVTFLFSIQRRGFVVRHSATTLRSLAEGVEFVWRNPVILGAMALDMFAVLLGGAAALFPVFAREVLNVGAVGYGWLAAAPAVGAFLMSLALVHRPPIAKAGRTLLWAVAGFGGGTIVFGLSTSFALSLAALLIVGACDSISVVVRHTLVQLLTPDRMRGRVSAISGMFISASNELGDFESGLVAWFTSPIVAVVSGGIGTVLVVAVAAIASPALRRYGRLDGKDRPELEMTSEPAIETPLA